jgi:hypothetical protein
LKARLAICLAFAAIALGLGGVATPLHGEETEPDLHGDCVPLDNPDREWECQIRPGFQILKVKCKSGHQTGLDPAWREASNEKEAAAFFAQQYVAKKNLHAFSQWLACQGFDVSIGQAPPGLKLSPGPTSLEARYRSSELAPFPVSWFDPMRWLGLRELAFFYLTARKNGQLRESAHYYESI